MSSLVWVSLACLVLALGVAALGYSQQKQQIQRMDERVQKVLDAAPTLQTAATPVEVSSGGHHWMQWFPPWVRHIWSPKKLVFLAAGMLLLAAVVTVFTHAIFGLITLVVALAVALFFTWLKWQKLRARLVIQLPSFIDTMVRMVVLGHATQSAFVMAAPAAKAPLTPVVMQAASFAKAGMPIEQALNTANRDYQLQELSLLAAVMQVGGRYGGRVDSLLERVSNFMRDKEQADRELNALSAEVRVSAWILSLLPLIVGGMIIVLNAAYFMSMWSDATGRWVGAGGLVLQLIGTVILFRMAKLED